MKLNPVSQTKGGANAVDKEFVEEYKDKHDVVATYAEYGVIAKLMSTYVKGWSKKLNTDSDSTLDAHLRPDYSFFGVVTGRLASKNPSLQTIPQRSKAAKLIKRMFIAKTGYLPIRYDYSAMEVRGWSWLSNDKVLANAFKIGQKLRQEFIVNPTKENADKVADLGDLHTINARLIFNDNLLTKKSPFRQSVKKIIFGLLYGMAPKSLGVGTKESDIEIIKNELKKLKSELKLIS
jgi:DNA polymerase-1